jgi:hypothetical protein
MRKIQFPPTQVEHERKGINYLEKTAIKFRAHAQYRIPDVYIPSLNTILDGTIGNKTPATPQIQDMMNWGNNRVDIVTPGP